MKIFNQQVKKNLNISKLFCTAGLVLCVSLVSCSSYGEIIYLDKTYGTYGETNGSSNGNCRFLCSKGNYNIGWKRSLCNMGYTPGWSKVYWFDGRFTYQWKTWAKSGTKQDHQGVCVSKAAPSHPSYPKTFLFHDGCTGYPDGNPRKMTKGPNKGWNPHNWGRVFHGACVVHDMCYKAEPAFSNKSKYYCDNQMYHYAKKICHESYEDKNGGLFKKTDLNKCLAEASNARQWLYLGSKAHYNAYNYSFDWRPIYTETSNSGVITTKSGLCPNGQAYSVSQKRCVTAAGPRCTAGRVYSNGQCLCPSGSTWNGYFCEYGAGDPKDPQP